MIQVQKKSTSGTRAFPSQYSHHRSKSVRNDNIFLPSYNTTKSPKSQSPLEELVENVEIFNQFKPKKETSLLLARSYERLATSEAPIDTGYLNKSERVTNCASFLDFAQNILSSGEVEDIKYLHKASFCRDRLCPMCEWRRSRKIFSQVLQITEKLQASGQYKFAMLTLTVPNVPGSELGNTLDRLFNSFKKLTKYSAFKSVVCGFFRRLEITYNNKKCSAAYNTFHPHFHVLLAFRNTYAEKNGDYIPRDTWLSMWQNAYQDNSITQVDIRMIDISGKKYRNGIKDLVDTKFSPVAKAVAEVAKYTCKASDYLLVDEEKTDYLVKTLSKALRGRRLTAFGGVFYQTFKKLKLEDMEAENADLVHGSGDGLDPSLDWLISSYYWKGSDYSKDREYILTVSDRQKSENRSPGTD